MKIHLHTFTWNEAALVPYFLRHYLPWVDKIFVYDQESTDGTPELLARHSPRVEVQQFHCDHYPEPEPMGTMRAKVWRASRGHADWVLLLDFDEFLWHASGVPAYLLRAFEAGYTVVQTFGWQMVAEDFPPEHVALAQWCRRGIPWRWYSKPVVFRPDQIDSTDWTVGCHGLVPAGNVRLLRSASLWMLHYKYLGLDYLARRYGDYRERMRDAGHLKAFGHYSAGRDKLAADFKDYLARALDLTL